MAGIDFKPLDKATFNNFSKRTIRSENTQYWIDRSFRAVEAGEKNADELLRDMQKVYEKSLADLKKEIEAFYGRYATENGLTLAEVNKRLDPKQLKSAIQEIKRYYDFAKPESIGVGMSREYRDELRRLSARAYMSRLEEIKARLKNEIVKLAAEQEKAMTESLKKTYAEANAEASYNIDYERGFTEGYSAPNADVLEKVVKEKWLDDNYSSRIWKDKGKLLTSIETELLSGIAQGHNPKKIAEAMSEKYAQNYKNCERVARTETIHTMNVATSNAYKAHGIEKYEFLCDLSERTCAVCGALDGSVHDLKYKQEGVNYPVMHPNCVLGDNIVIAPDAEALTRSEYSGDIFKIVTAKGRSLSITPNHIMLTARGWVRAKNLVKGDTIIYYSGWDKIAVNNPTNNNGVPTIEELFTSFVKSKFMTVKTMIASSTDFKGDVVKNSKIDIIFINSLLRNKENFTLLKYFSDFSFIKAMKNCETFFNSDSTLTKLLVCLGLAADCIVKGSDIASIFFGSSFTHHQLVSLRLPSDYNTRLIQSANNRISIDVKSLRKFVDTDSVSIKTDNLGNRQILSSVWLSDCNSVLSQNSSDWLLRTVENLSEFLNTLSAFIEFDEIINVDVSHFTGHVYDTSTTSTLYICNGFFSSNCRCTTIPHFEKDEIDALFDEDTRIAYDENHKRYDVPASMTYKEWKEACKKGDFPKEFSKRLLFTSKNDGRIIANYSTPSREEKENIEALKAFAEKGHKVVLKKDVNKQKIRSADCSIDYVKWEVKTNYRASVSAIDNELRACNGQSKNLIINIVSEISDEMLLKGLQGRIFRTNIENIVIERNGIIQRKYTREELVKK